MSPGFYDNQATPSTEEEFKPIESFLKSSKLYLNSMLPTYLFICALFLPGSYFFTAQSKHSVQYGYYSNVSIVVSILQDY